MNGASMNWACLVARICCLFVAFQGFVGAKISDNSKKYQPSLLEGRISRKRVAFDQLYASRLVEYHDGYLIQLAYNQPLFVHFDNKREPLDKVAAGVLNDFVSMKCDFPTQHSMVVPLGRNDNEFQFLDVNRGRDFNTSTDDYGKKSEIEKNDTSFPAYLGFLQSFGLSGGSNELRFWFSAYQKKHYNVVESCAIVYNFSIVNHKNFGEKKQNRFIGNFHGLPLQKRIEHLKTHLDSTRGHTEAIDILIYNENEFLKMHTNKTAGDNSYCFDPSLSTALSEMQSESTADVMSTVMGGMVKTVVEGAIDLLWKPLKEQVIFRDGSNVEDDLVGKTETNNNAEVPQVIASMLDAALAYNLTNLLTDSVTAAVAPRVSVSLGESLGFQIKNVIYEHAKDKVPDMIAKIVKTTIQARLIKSIPRLVTSALLARLSNTLTRSITHAVLPAVSRGVSQTNDQVYYCFQCYHYKKYCNYCHYSPENSYYNVYYSAYYADYFSDYYGKYYTLALDNLKSTWCRSNKCTPKQL